MNGSLKSAIAAAAGFLFFAFPFFGTHAATGDLIRSQALPAVYYINADGTRIAFPDEATYFSWYQDFSRVKFVSDEEIAGHALAGVATIRPGTRIVKTAISPKAYAVAHGGVLRWIASGDLAKMIFGSDWENNIAVIDESLLIDYEYGADITSGGQYWWKQEMDSSPDILADREPALAPGYIAPPSSAETSGQSLETQEEIAESSKVQIRKTLYILWDPRRPQYAAFDKAVLERILFGPVPSLAHYYSEESNGKMAVEKAGVLGWYTADKGPDYYWFEDMDPHQTGFVNGEAEATAEALKKADADFDFSLYDADADGTLAPEELGIFIVIPQIGEEANEIAVPYASEAFSEEVDGPFVPGEAPVKVTESIPAVPFKADGVTISSVSKIYTGMALGDKASFGTMLHSFARHVLKLGDISSASSFSLMSDHRSDLRLDPYSRLGLGWLEPKVIPKELETSIQRLEANVPGRTVLRIDRSATGGSGGGYFLIENRRRGGYYDNSLPDEGIAVWEGSTLRRLDPSTPVNDAFALWRNHGNHYSPTALELFWSDGRRSGIRMLGVNEASDVAIFTLEKKVLNDQELAMPASPIQ
jgi:M6 family metalloprotease-like protein